MSLARTRSLSARSPPPTRQVNHFVPGGKLANATLRFARVVTLAEEEWSRGKEACIAQRRVSLLNEFHAL